MQILVDFNVRVLVTGGAGFIGSHLTDKLLERGHEVVIFDSFTNYISPFGTHYSEYLKERKKSLIGEAEIVRGDTRNSSEILRTIHEFEPDRIVHLAALPIADKCNHHSEEAVSTILNGTVNVLEAIRDVDCVDRFVYASSSMIYGDFEYRPADESHPKRPKGVYGGTKHAGETITRSYCKQFDTDFVVVRPSAVYGPTDANRRVTQIFIENAIQGKPLELHGGGTQKLDFTHVHDTADGFALALTEDAAANETFNITRGEGREIRELADVISQHIEGTKTKTVDVDTNRPKRGALDISKAQNMLDYDPEYSLERGMASYIEFIQDMGIIESPVDHVQ